MARPFRKLPWQGPLKTPLARACRKAPYHGAHSYRWHGAVAPMAWVLCAANGMGAVEGPMAWGLQQIAPGWCGMEVPMAWAIQKALGTGRSAPPCRIRGRYHFRTGIRFFSQTRLEPTGHNVLYFSHVITQPKNHRSRTPQARLRRARSAEGLPNQRGDARLPLESHPISGSGPLPPGLPLLREPTRRAPDRQIRRCPVRHRPGRQPQGLRPWERGPVLQVLQPRQGIRLGRGLPGLDPTSPATYVRSDVGPCYTPLHLQGPRCAGVVTPQIVNGAQDRHLTIPTTLTLPFLEVEV